MWRVSQRKSIPFVSPLIYNNAMRTIDELVNEMYMDNEQHLEYMENMNGGDCDCNIHTTLNTIVEYWWDK
jgi:hypothetical protein